MPRSRSRLPSIKQFAVICETPSTLGERHDRYHFSLLADEPEEEPMRWIGRSCVGAAFALVLLSLWVNKAGAWGAVAVGISTDNTVSATVVRKATEAEAREAALQACRTAKGGAENAQSLCAVVGTFENQCVATVGPRWAIAASEQEVREEAIAKFCSPAELRLRGACIKVVASCDRETSQKQCTFSIFGFCVW
jgi:hypothetical protein